MKIKDVSLWEAFYWVSEEKSFTKAAARMKIGVPFLSKKISALEESLGVKLFQRTTRKISLTNEGQGFLPHISSVLEDLGNLELKFEEHGKLSGTIRFTCPVGLAHRLLAPLIVEFSESHPDLKFDMDVSDRVVDLIEDQMDFAIRIQEPSGANFIFKKIADNKHVFCASPQYLKKHKPVIRRPKDLHHHNLLMLETYYDYKIKNQNYLREYARRQVISGVSGLFLTELALHDGGVAVRSLWDIHQYLKSGRLVQVLENYPLENFGDIFVVIPSRKFISLKVRTFIDFIALKAKAWNF